MIGLGIVAAITVTNIILFGILWELHELVKAVAPAGEN